MQLQKAAKVLSIVAIRLQDFLGGAWLLDLSYLYLVRESLKSNFQKFFCTEVYQKII